MSITEIELMLAKLEIEARRLLSVADHEPPGEQRRRLMHLATCFLNCSQSLDIGVSAIHEMEKLAPPA